MLFEARNGASAAQSGERRRRWEEGAAAAATAAAPWIGAAAGCSPAYKWRYCRWLDEINSEAGPLLRCWPCCCCCCCATSAARPRRRRRAVVVYLFLHVFILQQQQQLLLFARSFPSFSFLRAQPLNAQLMTGYIVLLSVLSALLSTAFFPLSAS